jgi:hypothetical protein
MLVALLFLAVACTASAAESAGQNVTPKMRSDIRQIIMHQDNPPRLTNVTFAVAVGVSVPRTVHDAALPLRVVEIFPAWQGYNYILIGNDIIIIDDDYLIVFILEV